MGSPSGLGRCRLALAFAVLMDAAGTGALLTGIFARLRLRGRDFGDLLIYSGAVLEDLEDVVPAPGDSAGHEDGAEQPGSRLDEVSCLPLTGGSSGPLAG
ncbi:Hypothetical predicted protein [Podarcis lilfordi]|uniref:Uncharacterized protein n=1 Tax=Podarcis lilfordi TaxID=74358 RepID=A0AA35L7N2_9SAUR|nr:Hypothetical predicted protein [Podarcis lilfordi]